MYIHILFIYNRCVYLRLTVKVHPQYVKCHKQLVFLKPKTKVFSENQSNYKAIKC